MAKLTRMQKYAGIRDQMATDREASNKTNELNEYADKLKALEGIEKEERNFTVNLQDKEKTVEVKPVQTKPEVEFIPSFAEIEKDFVAQEKPIESEKESDSFLDFLSSLNADNIDINKVIEYTENQPKEDIKSIEIEDLLSNNQETKVEEVIKPTIIETPVVEENKDVVEPFVSPVEETKNLDSIDSLFNDIRFEPPIFDYKEPKTVEIPVVEVPPIAEFVQPVVEPAVTTNEPKEIIDEFTKETKEVVEEVKEEIKEEAELVEEVVEPAIIETPVVEEKKEVVVEEDNEPINEEPVNVVPTSDETFVEKIEDLEPTPVVEEIKPVEVNNDYINETLKEVDKYNIDDGRKTVDQVTSTIIDNLRHPENKQVNQESTKESGLTDEEFSNTVTLEIDKVLNEIKKEAVNKAPEVKIEKVVTSVEVKPDEFASKLANTKEPPASSKDAPVEIKTMEETLRQEALDTIKFNVDNPDDEDLDEYEDDAPNKVLNVILIILIVILVAILGVIVYYILFAKEII